MMNTTMHALPYKISDVSTNILNNNSKIINKIKTFFFKKNKTNNKVWTFICLPYYLNYLSLAAL